MLNTISSPHIATTGPAQQASALARVLTNPSHLAAVSSFLKISETVALRQVCRLWRDQIDTAPQVFYGALGKSYRSAYTTYQQIATDAPQELGLHGRGTMIPVQQNSRQPRLNDAAEITLLPRVPGWGELAPLTTNTADERSGALDADRRHIFKILIFSYDFHRLQTLFQNEETQIETARKIGQTSLLAGLRYLLPNFFRGGWPQIMPYYRPDQALDHRGAPAGDGNARGPRWRADESSPIAWGFDTRRSVTGFQYSPCTYLRIVMALTQSGHPQPHTTYFQAFLAFSSAMKLKIKTRAYEPSTEFLQDQSFRHHAGRRDAIDYLLRGHTSSWRIERLDMMSDWLDAKRNETTARCQLYDAMLMGETWSFEQVRAMAENIDFFNFGSNTRFESLRPSDAHFALRLATRDELDAAHKMGIERNLANNWPVIRQGLTRD